MTYTLHRALVSIPPPTSDVPRDPWPLLKLNQGAIRRLTMYRHNAGRVGRDGVPAVEHNPKVVPTPHNHVRENVLKRQNFYLRPQDHERGHVFEP